MSISEIAKRIGAVYGFKADARFMPFDDLKIRWVRTSDEISLDITDYIEDAPEEIQEGLLSTLFGKITHDMNATQDDAVVEYLNSEEFRAEHMTTFMERHGFSELDADLEGIWQELKDEGVVEGDMPKVVKSHGPMGQLGASKLFRTIYLPERLEGSRELLKFELAKQTAFIGQGYDGKQLDWTCYDKVKKHYGKEYDRLEILAEHPLLGFED